MGIFDSLFKKTINEVVKNVDIKKPMKSERVVFENVPKTLDEFKSLSQASLEYPFYTAALTVLALSYYTEDRDLSLSMYKFLSGPREITPREEQFIRDRFMDNKYVAKSFFEGTSPENNYTPALPLTVVVKENPYSYENEGYAKLWMRSSGADSEREVLLRKAKDGKWYLWDQFLLSQIRQSADSNPWA